MTRRRWTAAESACLRRDYPDTPTRELAARLDCTTRRLYRQAYKLGLTKERGLHGESPRMSVATWRQRRRGDSLQARAPPPQCRQERPAVRRECRENPVQARQQAAKLVADWRRAHRGGIKGGSHIERTGGAEAGSGKSQVQGQHWGGHIAKTLKTGATETAKQLVAPALTEGFRLWGS